MLAVKLIATGIFVSFVWMSILWLIGEKIKNAAIVDVGWGISILFYCFVYFLGTEGLQEKELLAIAIVGIWTARLSSHLYIDRIKGGKEEEGRYKKLREHFKNNIPQKLFLFFQAQGLFNAFLSLPFLIIALGFSKQIKFFDYFAFGVSLLAIIGETLADLQLKQFKKNPSNKGKVCDLGLWGYSRHPNYFFEFMIWVGFFLLSLSEPYGFFAIVAPAAILYTLLKFTGIPATEEQAVRSKGDLYRDYQARVSAFIPLPPKK